MFHNLVHLQSAIKKDPGAYREEFLEQFNRFQAALALFKQNPSAGRKDFQDLLLFVGHLAPLFAKENELVRAIPSTLCDLLRKHKTVVNNEVRVALCRTLMLMRSRGLLSSIEIHTVFFDVFAVRDKELRKMLFDFLINDVKTSNRNQRSAKVNAELRSYIRKILRNETGTSARMALALLVSLYRKSIWRDEAVVNMIAECVFSRCSKLVTIALRFFLKAVADDDADQKGDSSSDSDADSDEDSKTEKQLRLGFRVGRKTKKREKRLQRHLRRLKRRKNAEKGLDSQVDYGVLYSLNDPQTFAERLFKSLESCREKFRLRVRIMSLLSRLIAVHKLTVLNFYPYVVRYLQPRQLLVTRILVYSAQACHEHVPPDSVQVLLNSICKNFISERNTSEAITVGINTVREICARCPYAISTDLLNDLCEYKNWKKDKNVNSAARSLISLYRDINPSLLDRRHRGKPTDAQLERLEELSKAAGLDSERQDDNSDEEDRKQSAAIGKRQIPLQFGASNTLTHIPGSEALDAFQRGENAAASVADENADEDEEEADDPWSVSEDDSGDELMDAVSGDESESEVDDEAGEEDEDDDDEEDDDEDEEEMDGDSDEEEVESDGEEYQAAKGRSKAKRPRLDSEVEKTKPEAAAATASTAGQTKMTAAERAREILCSRILTDEDFEAIKRAQSAKEVTYTSARKRKAADNDSDDDDEDADDDGGNEFIRVADIASVAQSSRGKLVGMDKRSRAASIKKEKEEQRRAAVNPARKKGRRGREKPTTASRSKAEQRKNKPFMMVRPKLMRKRAKRSFHEKQVAMRKSLVKRIKRGK